MKGRWLVGWVFFLMVIHSSLFLPGNQGQPVVLKILSYNIKHGEGMDAKIDLRRIADVISKYKPDLVALQEVDKGCERSGKIDIAAELAQMISMEHRFGKFMTYQGGEYGMAVLSRLPIIKTIRHPLPEGAEPRCALEVKVRVKGIPDPVSFICIHNDWTRQSFRVKQIKALLRELSSEEEFVILAGDFNGERGDESMKILKNRGWQILGKQDKGGSNTFPSPLPIKEIDFFVIRNLPPSEVHHWVIDERKASDHRPIFAVISRK